MNVAIVQGTVRTAPDQRVLADQSLLISFDVDVEDSVRSKRAVAVSWVGPSGRCPNVQAGVTVTVVGTVMRRFYRSGGRTMSRTDLRPDKIVRGAGSRGRSAIQRALEQQMVPTGEND